MMPPVKGHNDPFQRRLELLLQLLSPWRNKPLTYGELAEKMGGEWTEEAVKSWAKRGEFSAAGRERIVELATEEGLVGVTAAWLRTGAGDPPRKPDPTRTTVRDASAKPYSESLTPASESGAPRLTVVDPVIARQANPLRPEQEETASMASNALQRALRLVQSNLHGTQDRVIMAEELERFADQLRTRLHFDHVAADLYKAALDLRKRTSA